MSINNNNTSFNNPHEASMVEMVHKKPGKFRITKENLLEIIIKNQQREFADEIDLLEKSYGFHFF